MIKFLSLLLAMALLTSCTTLPPVSSEPPNAQQWQQQQQNLLSLSRWQLRGKVAMKNGHEGGQADVFWTQTDAQTWEIKLVAPFGAGSSLLTANADKVMLQLSNGDSMAAANVDALLAEIPDWKFPVSGLRYWLFGIASPHAAATQMRWDAQGQLAVLEQDGWYIELQNYAPSGEYILPRKIFMRRLDSATIDAKVELKLVVREWLLP